MHLIPGKFIVKLKPRKLRTVCVIHLQHSSMGFCQGLTLVSYCLRSARGIGLPDHHVQRELVAFIVISLILYVLCFLGVESQSTRHLFLISVFFPLSHQHEECGSQHSLLSLIPVSVELSKEQPGSVILGYFIDKKAENKQKQG